MVWTASSVDNVSLDGEFIPFPGSMHDPQISDGAAITAIRSPPGVIGSEPNVSLPATTNGYGSAVKYPAGTYRKFSTTLKSNACWPASKMSTSLIPISG
jgi:hypothetical protein